MTEETRHSKGAQTKMMRTRARILVALDEIIAEAPAGAITYAQICEKAGTSTDPIKGGRHVGLREEIDQRIRESAQARVVKRRKITKLPVSMTAQQKIDELNDQILELQGKYASALQAVNVLSQVVEALSKGKDARAQVVQLFKPSTDANL